MVKVRAARSVPVNPPDATFILKRIQLWTALQRKVRHATEFVPLMKSCTVVKEEGDVVLRDAVLVQENGTVREMREEVTSYWQQWVCITTKLHHSLLLNCSVKIWRALKC